MDDNTNGQFHNKLLSVSSCFSFDNFEHINSFHGPCRNLMNKFSHLQLNSTSMADLV